MLQNRRIYCQQLLPLLKLSYFGASLRCCFTPELLCHIYLTFLQNFCTFFLKCCPFLRTALLSPKNSWIKKCVTSQALSQFYILAQTSVTGFSQKRHSAGKPCLPICRFYSHEGLTTFLQTRNLNLNRTHHFRYNVLLLRRFGSVFSPVFIFLCWFP